MQRNQTIFLIVLMVGLITTWTLNNSWAQTDRNVAVTPKPDGQVFQEMLEELRQLRATVQRGQQNTFHGQLKLEEIRYAQDRRDRLTRELNEVRANLAGLREQLPQLQNQSREAELQISRENDAQRRAQMEAEMNSFKGMIEQQRVHQTRQQEREGQLETEMRKEEADLNKLKEELRTIEAALGGSPVAAPKKKS